MKFSLVIPVAPERNAEILESVKLLNYPKKAYELLVEEGNNASKNRNNGIKKSKGKIIVFLDDDAYILPDYLTKLDNFFKKYSKIDIVGGPQLTPEEGEGFFAKTSGVVFSSIFGTFSVSRRYKQNKLTLDATESMLTSANLAVKKSTFEKIEGFNTELFPGEDPEFISRAKQNNLQVAHNPDMIIYHKRRNNFPAFFKQNFLYGATRPKKNKIAGNTPLFFLIPMFFSIYFMFLPLTAIVSKLLLIPIIIYILLAIIFAICDSFREKYFVGIFLIPFLYLAIHFAYGLGTIAGYINVYLIGD